MTTLEYTKPSQVLLGGSMSWWDPAAECAVTIAEPEAAPDLFAEYHRGAVASYAKFGVSDALDGDTARCAADTALRVRAERPRSAAGCPCRWIRATSTTIEATWAGSPWTVKVLRSHHIILVS